MLHSYIGIAVAVMVFMFFFFGNRIFPQLFVFDLFQAGIFSAQSAVQREFGRNVPVTGSGGDISGSAFDIDSSSLSSVLSGLSDSSVSVLDLEEGTGLEATESSTVSIGYKGTYIDKKTDEAVLFDENTDRTTPFIFTIGSGQVIPGFDIGVTGMRENGVRLVVIKPEMGYGDRQVGPIPPNTTLHFVIELYEVR